MLLQGCHYFLEKIFQVIQVILGEKIRFFQEILLTNGKFRYQKFRLFQEKFKIIYNFSNKYKYKQALELVKTKYKINQNIDKLSQLYELHTVISGELNKTKQLENNDSQSRYHMVATIFWLPNSRTFQDFAGQISCFSRTFGVEIPGYSRTN